MMCSFYEVCGDSSAAAITNKIIYEMEVYNCRFEYANQYQTIQNIKFNIGSPEQNQKYTYEQCVLVFIKYDDDPSAAQSSQRMSIQINNNTRRWKYY